jgi:hypothetical protein
MPHAPRSLTRNLSLVLVAILLFSLSAAAGAQATAYRYWNFWTQDGDTWSYSPVGPASTNPTEGSAQAWRFDASSPQVAGLAPADSPIAAFEIACADVSPIVGIKRVAIVIDYCAEGPLAANGYDLLKSILALRTDNGFICGISGYPLSECATPVTDYVASTPPEPIATNQAAVITDNPAEPAAQSSLAPLGTALVFGLLAVAGFYFWRRSRS